jgi:hypothetical protein
MKGIFQKGRISENHKRTRKNLKEQFQPQDQNLRIPKNIEEQ